MMAGMSGDSPNYEKASAAIDAFLEALDLPEEARKETVGTGKRVAQAYVEELLVGYRMSPKEILAEASNATNHFPVILRDIQVVTMCPHHLLPAVGVAHVGYTPKDKVAGFGAIAKLVECHSRRLVLQEEIAPQVVDSLIEYLGAEGAGCILEMSPTCMTARGPKQANAKVRTTVCRGKFSFSEMSCETL